MANYKSLSSVIFHAILLWTYPEVSATCKGCSTYLEFSLLKPVMNKRADFQMLVITDQKTNCTLEYGDSNEQMIFSPGLTNSVVSHSYKDAGIYDVIFECSKVMKSLLVIADCDESSAKLEAEYHHINSTIDLKLELKSNDCLGVINCSIYDMYFGNTENVSVDKDELLSGFSLNVSEPGFHKVGVKCFCREILYIEKIVHVHDPCFEKYFFPAFPRTSEWKPFEIYENSVLLINEELKPINCPMNITGREWKIMKRIGTAFKPAEWTFSDQATFPIDAPFGLYRIELEVNSGNRSHSDTLYLLYREILRPLQVHGGSIQSMDSPQIVRLFQDEKQKRVYYLWCYKRYVLPKDIEIPLLKVSLENNVNCEPFTTSNSFQLPANPKGTVRLVQVFAITETDFREGRSLIRLVTKQKNHVPVNIRCIYNCDSQVSANINWVLKLEWVNTFNLDDSLVTYEWTVQYSWQDKYTKFDKKGNWIEGADTPALTIRGGALQPGTFLRVCAKISANTNSASFEGSVCNEAFCGLPPSGGKCELSSRNGIALETNFTINCTGFVDDGIQAFRQNKKRLSPGGISYAVFFKSDDNVALVYYGIFGEIGPFYLGTGDKDLFKASLYIRIYDIYYSFMDKTFEITVNKPSVTFHPLGDIEKYLQNRLSNIDHLPRQDQFNVMNSVSGVINKMVLITNSLMEKIKYNVNDMTRGKFIDFDLKKNVFKTWEEMMTLLENEDHKMKIKIYSKIITDYVEKIGNLSRHNDDVIGVLSTLGTLNLAISYHPYVSQYVIKKSVEIAGDLLKRALQLCHRPVISVFMTDITDCSEILLGRMMSVINTEQIILAKEGFGWDTVRKYMESNQGYVKSEMIDSAMQKSEIDEFERFYIVQKTYLESNIGINQKREQAGRLSSNLVDSHFRYLKMLIQTMSLTGRNTKSQTGTSICAKKEAGNREVNGIGCGQLNLLVDTNGSSPSGNVKEIQALTTKENLFTYDKNMRSSLVSQPTMILTMESDNNTNRSFIVKFKNKLEKPNLETPKFIVGDQAKLFYHRFIYRSKTDYACIRLIPENGISSGVPAYEAYFRLLLPPNNDTFHYRTAFLPGNLTVSSATNLKYYELCIPPGVFKNNGSLFVGFRPFIPADFKRGPQLHGYKPDYYELPKISNCKSIDEGSNLTSVDLLKRYSFEAISINCIVWDGTEWSGKFCRPLWTDEVACKCFSNKQVTVTSTFFVAPNVIDFSTVFTKFDIINNGTVFAVVLGTFLLFIIIFVIAWRQDRKEEHMDCFRSLSDNSREDSFYYLIIVHTGLKVGAGTQSNICFHLSGENAVSGVRSLSDEAHKGFKSGSTRKFLMNTPRNLGDLLYLRIWIDGSGIGDESSWFLDRFEVMEVVTEIKYVFRCNAWLTTDESGQAVYLLPSNRFHDEMTFSSRFKENIYESMTDSHLWFSAYMRPCYGQFTRAQRVTCCALVLYLTMIANAMFYRSGENLLKPNQFTLGPLRFSTSQIAISLESIAITIPPTFLALIFFKNSRPQKYKRLDEEQRKEKEVNGSFNEDPSEFAGTGFLPHWCVYLGWLLAVSAILASGFFVILFSIQWGKTKSEEWMTTFLLSISQSLFLVDPLKVFLVAFMIAILGSKKRDFKLTYFDNMSILQEMYKTLYKGREKPAKFHTFPPMGRRECLKRRRQVEHEIWMRSILLNFIMYALLLWSSTSLAFTNRNPHAFLFKDHLEKTFADPPGSAFKFSEIKSVTSFYQWTRNTVYPALFPMKDFAGKRLFWIDKKFINDGVSVRIGPIRLRQLRIQQPENCSTYRFTGISDCYPAYSFSREEKSAHCLRWNKISCGSEVECSPCGYEIVYNETLVAWSYTPASQISGLPTVGIYNTYSGGGYIMNIQVNDYISNKIQQELIRAKWIDRKTRAVFLEFTLYNANSNQFANFFFLVEFPESGGTIPYHQINVITAYNSFDPYTVTCMVIFLLCFVVFIIKNAYNLLKERTRFFKNFWNLVDLCAFFTSSSASVAYTMQYFGTQAVLEQYRQDPRIFVNFYYLVVWNLIITYNLAFQIFFTIIRLSCILGISQKISEIAAVIKNCVSELMGVFCIFSIYALAYTMVGNLSFPTIYSYRSYGSSLIATFLLLLGKNDFVKLINVSPIVGKIYFVSEIFFMIFVILKMFESVLTDSISSKKKIKIQLSLLELFMRRLRTSRMSNAARRKKRKRQNEVNDAFTIEINSRW